ncbi:excinuclease ABC subunit UvrA [Candidatus Microgenomates bacterium]|nr:MAG: excinuclease ABC subunit UvrA [Candidatus Microgenomates bacterium]
MDIIKVRGARQHNLKNLDLDIPKNQLVVFSGVSGSGKSSIAFDTIYAEGQRRYVESLSTYARQFLGIMKKPDVDSIEGLSPAISIDQKTVSHNPRSTVGTVTEIYDYFRLLFARIGHPHCHICGREIASQSVDQIVEGVMKYVAERVKKDKKIRFMVLSPVVKDRKGEFVALFDNLKSKGFRRVRIDGVVYDLEDDFVIIKTNKHSIDAIIDRISVESSQLKDEVSLSNFERRLTDAIEQALKLSDGLVLISEVKDLGFEMPDFPKKMEDHMYSEKFACPVDNIQLSEIEPRSFSFNSPHGACPACTGLGMVLKVDPKYVFAPELSIKEGGIIPYATIFEHDTWLARLILEVCLKNDINPNAPIKTLSASQKEIILYGTKNRVYRVEGTNRQGKITHITEQFGGVVGELTKRHATSDSEYIRKGIERYMAEKVCEVCAGARLNKDALNVTINGLSIHQVTNMSISKTLQWSQELQNGGTMSAREREIAALILKEINSRLEFLQDVGLDYLTLSRTAYTLSGGESQRIRLASQIGSGLTGVLYVLDEPTIGLHPKDNTLLIETLKKLRDLGNSVVVVEHDSDVINASDYMFEFGPGAGKHGGGLTAQGTPVDIKNNDDSLTGKYLSGRRKINFPKVKHIEPKGEIVLEGADSNNLKNLTVHFPLGKLIVVTGVSGSGKSTLVVDTLYHALASKINKFHKNIGGEHVRVQGVDNLDKVILIDQSPIGRTPRSNPATYTKVFDLIRDVFAETREAKLMGFKKGRFSFNVKGGRCENCEGQGKIKIEMQFMPDIWIDCEICGGTRYSMQTLEVAYKGKSIADVLAMTTEEAREFFHVYKHISDKLETLVQVGLDYMELGQSATTLSGGEAQRVKLASELSKRATGKTFYILDEPTTGLHFADLEKLLGVLKILVERGNTVCVIEHNLDVIKNADWVIDLGPEGGDFGGKIVAEGTPEEIANTKSSFTGQFLKRAL